MLEIQRNEQYTTITLAHGKVNVLNLDMLRAITDAVKQEQQSGTKGLIITGSGSTFSAGVDLFKIRDDGPEYIKEFLLALSDMLTTIFDYPGPTVAAINGHAIAGGCLIAIACDFRLMAAGKGRIGVPEMKIGVPFPIALLEHVRYAVPAEHHAEVIYGGGTWQAEEAMGLGLVDSVCEPQDLINEAEAAMAKVIDVPPATYAMTKNQLHRPTLDRIAAGADYEAKVVETWQSSETIEMIRDYLQRTVGK